MPERAEGHLAAAGSEGRLQSRLARLVAVRLVLCLALFGAAVLLHGVAALGAEQPGGEGLYATLAFAFLSTIALALFVGRIRHTGTFAAIQIPTDALLVTGVVHFTGGDESLFSFLYVLVVVFGSIVAGRGGAFGAAAVCAGLHGSLLAAEHTGLIRDFGGSPGAPEAVLWVFWSVHAAALLVVALLGSQLTRELATAGAELDASRSDLRRLRSLHERIVESLLSGLLTTDPQGRIVSFNGEAERITGFGAADVLGLDIDEVIPGAGTRVVLPALDGEEPPNLRLRLTYTSRRGDDLHLGLAGSPLRDADGTPRGSVVIFQDVTRVVEMEGDLRRSERLAATGRLAADIAHEVRNPLAAISGSIQMLLAAGTDGSTGEGARLMEIVLRETDRLNGLIDDFLQYAHPRPPKIEDVDLSALVSDVVSMLGNVSEAVSVEPALEPAVRVLADAAQLRQLLWNLCANGVQAMPQGGVLRIEARSIDAPQAGRSFDRNGAEMGGSTWVEIRVSDHGVGIPPEDLDRIFDPFFTTKESGTGLGLATVHRIVEGHGGTLQVESSVGLGTTFRILLPLSLEES